IAAKAGIAPPTPAQVLSLYKKLGTNATLKQVLLDLGPYPSLPPVLEAGDTSPALEQPNPLDVEQLTFQMQAASQDLAGLLWSPGDLDAFRTALSTVMGHAFNNADIRPVAMTLADGDPQMLQLRDELSLVLSTRTRPLKLRFVGDRIQH